MSESEPSPEPDVETLRQLLEESELRKDARNKRIGGRFTLIVTVPILLLFAWAGIFLLQYDDSSPIGEKDPAVITPGSSAAPLTDEQKEMAQYDMFRDEKDRVVKTNALGLEKTSDKIVDKEDIRFAMELLNFMHSPPDTPQEKH